MKVDGTNKKGGGGKGVRKRQGDSSSTEWFNPKPSGSDVEWLDSHENEFVGFVVALVERLEVGRRLSVRYDAYSERWLAILFVDPDTEGGTIYALSVRGATAFDAGVLLYYFHYVKFKDGWLADAPINSGRFG